jgi:hypothetical protein
MYGSVGASLLSHFADEVKMLQAGLPVDTGWRLHHVARSLSAVAERISE